MRWDDLRYLDALARTGSAGAAARELTVSASTVYRRVDALEAAVGVPLLVRGAEPIALTDPGARLVELARAMKLGLHEVAQKVQSNVASVQGRVKLTTVEGYLPLLVEPLAELAATHPDLTVELHLGHSGPSVRKREADVAIGVMSRPPSGLVGRRIAQIAYGVFGTKAALERKPLRWVVFGPSLQHTQEAEWEQLHAGDASVATSSRHAFTTLMCAGVGVGLLPRPIAAQYPELQELDAFRDTCAELKREAWTLMHPDMKEDPRVRALLDALTRHLAD